MKLKKKDLKIVGKTSHSGKIVDPQGISSTVLGQRMNTVPHILMKSPSSTDSAGSEGSGEALNSAEDTDASDPMTSTSTPTKSTQPDSEEKTIIQATLGESIQGTSPIMISFAEAFLAKPSLLRAKGKVSKTLVERYSSRYTELSKTKNLSCYSLKTLKASFLQELSSAQESIKQLKEREKENLQTILNESKTNPEEAGKKLRSMLEKATSSLKSSSPYSNWGIGSNTRFLTASISEFPRLGRECSLSDILEKDVPDQYFLSQSQVEALTSGMQESKLHQHYKAQDTLPETTEE